MNGRSFGASAWLEYFADGPNAPHFAALIEKPTQRLVPSVTLLKVPSRVRQQRDDAMALQCVGLMQRSSVVDRDAALAVRAATLGRRHRLPLADSIVYSTAQAAGATVRTQDADFEGLPSVRFRPKAAP